MGSHKLILAAIIKNPLDDDEFLLTKQALPPKFNHPEYDSFQDSHLWDLPSAQLSLADRPITATPTHFELKPYSFSELRNQFDVDSALEQVLGQVGFHKTTNVKWNFLKIIEEPEFGPGPGVLIKTLYIVGELESHDLKLEDCSKWANIKSCADLLLEVKPQNDRIGPLVVIGLLNDSLQSAIQIPPTLRYQEYPPGVKIVPMRSRTAKPFHTTNLIVFAPEKSCNDSSSDSFFASGDALIVDPGCSSAMHKELAEIITALPRKLFVFVTHHHHDHVDGLSIVQKCNPDATLLAHENTARRIGKGDWSLGHLTVQGSEEICIGGQRLRFISAPGHTDGHVALLHVGTNSLIVGDHCVGQGSALLDINSGGNMSEYFHTTYKFLELSPHVLIPMHGRINLWPKNMLCGYLKNRRKRELTILEAIEDGAKTLFDIVKHTYANVDRSLWIHAASNVRLHVDHLALQNKLPQKLSMQRFQSSCKLSFYLQWIWEYVCSRVSVKRQHLQIAKVVGAGAAVCVAAIYLR